MWLTFLIQYNEVHIKCCHFNLYNGKVIFPAVALLITLSPETDVLLIGSTAS